MKSAFCSIALTIFLVSCAHTQKELTPPSKSTATAPAAAVVPSSPKLEVPLPYTYTRRGVDIRANSVEHTNQQVRVSLTLKETQNQDVELHTARLVRVRRQSGQELTYLGWSRMGGVESASEVQVKAGERFSIEVIFQSVTSGPQDNLELLFPTGKWWNGAP